MLKNGLKKIMCLYVCAITAFTVFFAFTACSDGGIKITGSSSVTPLMEVLTEAYELKNPGISFDVVQSDSTTGITDTVTGKNSIGMASRDLKESEKENTVSVPFCKDGIVLITNKDISVSDVTGAEVYDLYTAGKAISGIEKAITRESGSGTFDAFSDLIVSNDGKKLKNWTNNYAYGIVETSNSTNVVLSEISKKGAKKLGYVSLGSLSGSDVKTLSFEGVAATNENIKNGSYKLSRAFNLVIKSENYNGEIKAFIDWILGSNGASIIESEGYVALI